MKVVLADYGAGNLFSVTYALERAGATTSVTTDAQEVREAPLAVIAGSAPARPSAEQTLRRLPAP